jgi:hypothetical protein
MTWKLPVSYTMGWLPSRVWNWISEHEVSIGVLETLTVSLPDSTNWYHWFRRTYLYLSNESCKSIRNSRSASIIMR